MTDKNHTKIKGTVEEIIFKNEENGYVIAVIEVSATGEFLYVKGYLPFLKEGEELVFEGQMKIHPTYGEQFEVVGCEAIMPETEEAMIRYLGSGIVKGVGPSLAGRIVDEFGMETFDILQFSPEKLLKIQGIGEKKYVEIVESFKEQSELRSVMMFLQKFGISIGMATKIYRKYGSSTVEFVSTNPYRLADEIDGVGFKAADSIAVRMGISPVSPFRVCSGIKYILNRNTGRGDTYMMSERLVEETVAMLSVQAEEIQMEVREMIIRGDIMLDGDRLYMPFLFHAEVKSARKLVELSLTSGDDGLKVTESEMQIVESDAGIELHSVQRQAVTEAIGRGLSVITGGPGTGKTTVINCIIDLFERKNKKVLLAAPTGRAAKRMTEATHREAKTIHRLLEYSFAEEESVLGFSRNEDNPIEADVVIIDEVSMVDINLLYHLLVAIVPGTRLILVGDCDQLPSVGPGTVLKDIIESNLVPVTMLTEIFRQGKESMIVVNAHKINKAEAPIVNEKDKDFYLISERNPRLAADTIRDLCTSRLKKYYGFDPMKDIHVLSPAKSGPLGTLALNDLLQNALNPSRGERYEKKFGERLFRVGDKVMQTKNNYALKWTDKAGTEGDGVYNGDIGFITDIDFDNRNLTVLFDEERTAIYEFTSVDELSLSYCTTVHKSQGSEYPVIVMPLYSTSPMLMSRNILYTAVTRARKLVVLVGSESIMTYMIGNEGDNSRLSGLQGRIKAIEKALEDMDALATLGLEKK